MSRTGIMLAYPFEEKRLLKWQPPYIVQPKLDGVRMRSVPIDTPNGKSIMLLSSEENVLFCVPHIRQALLNFPPALELELDGELYCHSMSFEQISSIAGRTVNIHPDHELLKYYIFDYVSEADQLTRTLQLTTLPIELPLVRVPHFVAQNLDDVMRAYDTILQLGYEGIIVRHIAPPYMRKRSTYMMKFKPKKDDWYRVIDSVEEVSKDGVPKGSLGSLACVSNDGCGEVFFVGSGLTAEQRATLWKIRDTLPGKQCHVQYQHTTTGKGVPRFPVFMEVV
uniref:Polydeoxyribonucleotide synthase [ATP] n=1 Tax=viral metagenome TaxID=1070528 RepID=A0A6M3K8L4_9ZZZZ